jgi:hypothetical protein
MNGGREVPAALRRAIAGAVMFGLVAGAALVVVEPAAAGPEPAAATLPRPSAVVQHQAALDPFRSRCVVTANNVNYRRGPGTQYASLGQVNRGFAFDSDEAIPNPRNRYQYWDVIERSGHAAAYIDDIYISCWPPH